MPNLQATIASYRRLDRGVKIRVCVTMALAVVIWVVSLLQIIGVFPS
jgi:hypothetical protein